MCQSGVAFSMFAWTLRRLVSNAKSNASLFVRMVFGAPRKGQECICALAAPGLYNT